MNAFVLELLAFVVIVVLVFAYTRWKRVNRIGRRSHVPPGYERTPEVNVDPTTGARQQVWFNPQTGERYYQTIAPPKDQNPS